MKGWFNPALSAEQCMLKFAETNDGKLLSRLVELFNDDLFHYLLSQSDPHLAEDLVQMVWLKVIEKRHFYQFKRPFKYWLFRIARNCLIDELRRKQRWRYADINEADNAIAKHMFSSANLEDVMAMRHQQQAFDFVLEQLPFAQRDAFILQQEGFSIDEIASICGDKSETIKSRLRYARQFFKRHMECTHGNG